MRMKAKLVKKGICNTDKYSFQNKVDALYGLSENDFNFNLTAEELSIPRSTLYNWNKNMGAVIHKLLNRYGIDHSHVTEEAYNRIIDGSPQNEEEEVLTKTQYHQLVFKAACKALKKMDKLISTETELRNIATTMKLLSSILDKEAINQDQNDGVDEFGQFLLDKLMPKSK